MRRVRYSRTFLDQLDTVIAMGEDRFGARLVGDKRDQVLQLIERHIADKPRTGNLDEKSGLYWYPVSRTPFVIYYDFDAQELRLYYVMFASAERSEIDPDDAEWAG